MEQSSIMGFLAYTNAPGLKIQHQITGLASPAPAPATSYKECMRNQAASIGGLAFDGCREFMPEMDPTTLLCGACGCHRSFHRPQLEVFHRHIPPSSPATPAASASPQRLASKFHKTKEKDKKSPSAPVGGSRVDSDSGGKKRFRSKFRRDQKKKMLEFSMKLGWKLGKTDPMVIQEFCKEVGVDKQVFKVWMNNNKHTLGNI